MKKRVQQNKNNNISIICGIIGAALFLFVMNAFGNPYGTIHKIDVLDIIPPIWLWNISELLWGFLIGYAAGRVIFDISCIKSVPHAEMSACKGGLFYIVAFFLSLSHYPLFFIEGKLLLSLITAFLSLIFASICGVIWIRVSKTPSLIMIAYSFWLFYVVFVNFSIFIKI